MTTKIFAYVDGYNLYNGINEPKRDEYGHVIARPLRKYLWLNLQTFIYSFLPKEYEIVKIHYFTATVRGDPEAKRRQQVYWKALETIPHLERHLGRQISDGHGGYAEKQSDVKLALQMYCDVLEEKTQSIVLVSGDSDQVPTINRIHALDKGIEFFAIFPPDRFSQDIADIVPRTFKVREPTLRANQFPDTIKIDGIPEILKPVEWI